MTSRERVLSAINHNEPDKVPVDLGSNPSSGISAIAYGNLIDKLGWGHLPIKVYDVVQQLTEPADEIIELFGIDVLDLGRTFNTNPSDWQPTTLANGREALYPAWFNPEKNDEGEYFARNESGEIIAKMPHKGTFFDQTVFPWIDGYPANNDTLDEAMSMVLWQAFAHSPWDKAGEEGFWDRLRSNTIKLREESGKAVMMVAGCNLFEWGTFIRRMDNFLMDLHLERASVEMMLDGFVERHLQSLERICSAVGDVADIIRFGDDLGMINGPFMDPQIYRDIFKPRHKIMTDYVKKHSKMKILLHSCGSIYQLIPDILEAGFEILNPVQTNCRDMDPVNLKKEFGRDATFWGGGIETAGVLNKGTTEDVRRQTLERLEIFSKGGGFVFNPVHNILPEVPPENIIAMFNAVKEFNGDL